MWLLPAEAAQILPTLGIIWIISVRRGGKNARKKTPAAALNTYPKLRAHGGSMRIACVIGSKQSKVSNKQNNEAFHSFVSIRFADVKPPEPHDTTK